MTPAASSGQVTSLPAAVAQVLAAAIDSSAGRSAHTLTPGAHALLKQTLLALRGGESLKEHESPTAATLHVLRGRVRLVAGALEVEMGEGDHAPIPPARHHLDALDDSVVLLTVAQPSDQTASGAEEA